MNKLRQSLSMMSAAGLTKINRQGVVMLLTYLTLVAALIIIFVYLYKRIKESRRPMLIPYDLSIRCEKPSAEVSATHFIRDEVEKQIIKSKSVRSGVIELTMKVYIKDDQTGFVNDLASITGVTSVVMVRSTENNMFRG